MGFHFLMKITFTLFSKICSTKGVVSVMQVSFSQNIAELFEAMQPVAPPPNGAEGGYVWGLREPRERIHIARAMHESRAGA